MKSLLTPAVLLVLLVAGCGGEDEGTEDRPGSADARRTLQVNIAGFEYSPDPVSVKAGGRVTWTNRDRAPHTATTDEDQPGELDTGRLELSDSGTLILERPGTYAYYCTFHRFMTGTIEVVE